MRAPPKLAIPAGDVLKINDTIAPSVGPRIFRFKEGGKQRSCKVSVIRTQPVPFRIDGRLAHVNAKETAHDRMVGTVFDASQQATDVDAPAIHVG
jgi:hypothetical protein